MHEEGFTSRMKRALHEGRYLIFLGYVCFFIAGTLIMLPGALLGFVIFFIFSSIFKLLPKRSSHIEATIVFIVIIGFCALSTTRLTDNFLGTFLSWFKSFGYWLTFAVIFGVIIGIVFGFLERHSDKILLERCQKILCPECGDNFGIKEASQIGRWMSSGKSGIFLYCSKCETNFQFVYKRS